MMCAPDDLVVLHFESKNPFDKNSVAVWSNRDTQLGYINAVRALLIGKRMKKDDATAVFQTMHCSGAYIRMRFRGGLPTLPPPIPDVEKRPPPRQMRPAQRPVYDPHAFYPDEKVPERGA